MHFGHTSGLLARVPHFGHTSGTLRAACGAPPLVCSTSCHFAAGCAPAFLPPPLSQGAVGGGHLVGGPPCPAPPKGRPLPNPRLLTAREVWCVPLSKRGGAVLGHRVPPRSDLFQKRGGPPLACAPPLVCCWGVVGGGGGVFFSFLSYCLPLRCLPSPAAPRMLHS